MRGQPDLPGLSTDVLRLLREDEPSQRELRRAYLRFLRRPQPRSHALLVSRWLIAGLAVGLSVAFGAEAIEQRMHERSLATLPPAVASARPRVAQRREPARRPADTPSVAPAAPDVAPKNPASAGPVSARAPVPSHSATAAAESAAWAKAAAGLRNHDVAQTESALAVLEQANSVADREAARLVRAQLMLHQGDVSGARALLRELSSHAQSSLVRAKARHLLEQDLSEPNSPLGLNPSGT